MAQAGKRAHARIVTAAAGAADGDDRIGIPIERRGKLTGQHRAARRRNGAGEEGARSLEHGVAAGAGLHQVDARLAHHHVRDAGRRQNDLIDRAQTLAGTAQDCARTNIGVDRQHPFAGSDRAKRLMAPVAADHGIERCNGVGVGRHDFAHIDAQRRRQQWRGRIGAGVGGRLGAHRKTVAQRARRRRKAGRRHHILGQHATHRQMPLCRARLDRQHQRFDAREHVGKRRQPRDPLGLVVPGHRGSLSNCHARASGIR